MKRQLVVMVKEPRPGRVKTRLGREIGMIEASRWFRHQSLQLVRRLQDPRWDLTLAVSPDHAGLTSRVWPGHLPRIAQGPGNLGDRMGRIFRGLPPGPVVIIGADIPEVERPHIVEAFTALGRNEAVIGPAPDGGYWLIGLARRAAITPSLFAGVRWSTSTARADTMETLGTHRIAEIAELSDVDTAADLKQQANRRRQGVRGSAQT